MDETSNLEAGAAAVALILFELAEWTAKIVGRFATAHFDEQLTATVAKDLDQS
jgi:hypothetical protein